MSSCLSDVHPQQLSDQYNVLKVPRIVLLWLQSVYPPTKLCINGSIVAMKSLSRFGKTPKALTCPSFALVAFVSLHCRHPLFSMYVRLCNMSQLLIDISYFCTFLFIQSVDLHHTSHAHACFYIFFVFFIKLSSSVKHFGR